MDQYMKTQLLKLYHSQSEKRQKAMMKDYLNVHPGISSSDDWLNYLVEIFELGKLGPGPLVMKEDKFISSANVF